MKISKAGILTLGVMFLIGSMGLILVNAEEPEDPEETEELEVNIYIDPSNAIQHIQEVHFVSTGGNTRTAKMKRKDNRLVGIETSIDFILSKTGDDINTISSQNGYNSILGGIKNKILGRSKYSVILAGLGNVITGKHNTIIGGKSNSILGESSTILGGSSNYVTGDYSVIVGSKNHITGDYSVTVGSDNIIKGNNSVVMGVNTEIKTDNSFSLNLKSGTGLTLHDKLNVTNLNNVFLINSDSGVVINSDKAHSFSKLTLGGSLSIFSNSDDENIQCGSGKGGGIIKAVNTNAGQMCLCSCDGSGWNSMLARGTCVGACEQPQKPECGERVERVCSDEGITYSGSCEVGLSIEGEGSYLVDKHDKVHWSCQTEDGSITFCSGSISAGVNECVFRCVGELPSNAQLNGMDIATQNNVSYFYDPESTDACSYKCMSGFNYVIDDGEELCVKCKDGTYNTGNRTCEQEAVCEDGKVPYNGGCIYLGECLNKPNTFNIWGIEQFNGYWNFDAGYPDFKPYGGNTTGVWTCKSSSEEVHPHSCEFSCKDGYHCDRYFNGFWGDYCQSNKLGCCGYVNRYSETGTLRMERPEFGVWRWVHPVYNSGDQQYNAAGTPKSDGGYLAVEFVDSLDDLIDKKTRLATGCYYFCDLGFHERVNIPPNGSVGKCDSNCKNMHLGAIRNGEPLDMHDRNDASYITGWFHNGRFERNATKVRIPYNGGYWNRSGGTLTEWTYVDSGVLDDAVANNTGICLWTCRSGIPIPHIDTVSPFKETFNYGYTTFDFNTCWERCPDGYYFNKFKCVKVSTDQYIPDPTNTILYSGVENSIAEVLACNDPGTTYQNGQCVRDFTSTQCPEGYKYIDGHCITCRVGQGFSGDNCVDYNRCDADHNRLINEKDRDFVSNCINNGGIGCDSQANLNHDGSVNSGDLQYFDDICYKQMCDHNGDGEVDTGDLQMYGNVCKNSSRESWCDLSGNGTYGNEDRTYRSVGGICRVLIPG